MVPDDAPCEAQIERLLQLLRIEIAGTPDPAGLESVRAIAAERAAEIQKAMRGLLHSDPKVRAAWEQAIGHLTPAQSWHLFPILADPPGEKGRPKGTGYKQADLELMPEIHRRVLQGETLAAVTEDIVQRSRDAGHKPSDSAAVRLQRRYRDWLKAQNK